MSSLETPREVRAQAKYVRMSPRKARLVAEHIRGRSVPEARAVLAFTQRAAAREIEKVLSSAVANAEANHGLVGDELYVHAAVVDDGPTLKRWRARARGRVARIKKHTCHITVLLAPLAQEGAAAPAESPRRAAKPVVEAPEAVEVTAPPDAEAAEEPKAEQPQSTEESGTQPDETEQAEKPKPRRTPRRKKTEE